MVEYGVDDKTGFNRKGFEKIRESLENRAKSLWGEDIDLTSSSALRKLIDSSSLEIARLWDTAESIYSSSFLEEAYGQNLDRLGHLLGIYRNPPTFASGDLLFEGEEGKTINSGFTVERIDGVKFETIESGTIDSEGEAIIQAQCIRPGSIGNTTGEDVITNFVDHKAGVTSVTNYTSMVGGEDRENDRDLKLRIRRAIEIEGKAVKSAIESTLLSIDGITSVSLQENLDRSVLVYIGGLGNKSDLPQETIEKIDETIEDVRAFGIPFSWETPTQSNIYIGNIYDVEDNLLPEPAEFTVEVEKSDTDEAKDIIVENIMSYINSLDVSENVIFKKLIGTIYASGNWVYDIKGLYIAKNYEGTGDLSEIFSKENISIALEETAIVEDNDILIEVVKV